jgi:hypothetical protein
VTYSPGRNGLSALPFWSLADHAGN